jgi:DNA ligase-1
MSFKPMLAAEADLSKIRYPVYGSPKVDGIRATVLRGRAYTRSLKSIPNVHVANKLGTSLLNLLDGEITVGPPNHQDVYRNTVKGVMAHEGQPDFTFWVFDAYLVDMPYDRRLDWTRSRAALINQPHVRMLPTVLIQNEQELLQYEHQCILDNFEGVCIRAWDGPYKTGRSTVNEGGLLKLKRFVDSEAVVLGVQEEMFNGNAAEINELGRTKRSTAKAGLTGKGTMGALHVRDCTTGIDFFIGTGFTAAERAEAWNKGDMVKYKYFPVGIKDAPRHPVYLGRRHRADISR